MTVNTITITSGPYTATGGQTLFDYTFRVDVAADLDVYVNEVLRSDYTVLNLGVDTGGQIQFNTGLTSGDEVYIRSSREATQDTEFSSQGGFYPEEHERAFDKLTYLIQQLADKIKHTLRIADTKSELTSVDLVAGRFLQVNATGDGFQMADRPVEQVLSDGVINTVADIPYTAMVDGAIYTLKEYHAGTGKGGRQLKCFAGSITPDNVLTFNGPTGFYLQSINVTQLFAEMGGAVGDGTTNDHLAIQRCIDVLMNLGGGNLYFEPKTYRINAKIDIYKDNVVLCGSGGNQPHDGGDYTAKGTRFLWGGDANYMFNFYTPNTATASRVTGVGIKDCWLICNAVALGGLKATSIRRGIFENIYVADPVWCAYHLSSYTSTGKAEAMDLQGCIFSRCTFRAIDSTAVENATGFLLSSENPDTDTANVSLNEFHMCSGQVKNGKCWLIENADNNSFYTCSARVTGTGEAMAIHGRTDAADSNIFWNFAGPSIFVRGTASGYAHNPKLNAFINTDEGNGTPYPTMDAGCMVQWHGLIKGFRKSFGTQLALTDSSSNSAAERDLLGSETIRIRNNSNNHVIITDGTNSWGINIESGTGDLRILRNSGSGALNLGNGVTVIAAGIRMGSGTAAPTTGTWQRGSIFYNSQPAVGFPLRWICTVTGTPGTWVSEGDL